MIAAHSQAWRKKHLRTAERDTIFHNTASRVYRLQ